MRADQEIKAWKNVIAKLRSRLSKWKVKTLSIGGRLTLLKSFLGASYLFISFFKVPRGVLKIMEAIRSRFFNGIGQEESKITWIAWNKALASKKRGGLGVSSFFCSQPSSSFKMGVAVHFYDGSYGVINRSKANLDFPCVSCKKESYGDTIAVELTRLDKDISVAEKMNSQVTQSFRREPRGDEVFLPKAPAATRWLKLVPIKVNIFVWKLQCDRLPTRNNLVRRGVHVPHACCPVCETGTEDVAHLFFLCEVARDVSRLICRWWNISWMQVGSFAEWLDWFTSIRLGSRLKSVLEGVFLVAWSFGLAMTMVAFSSSKRASVIRAKAKASPKVLGLAQRFYIVTSNQA
ncbi:RNA-directed DNA polymerase, eukaryota [Tanacetum coccineum]